MPERSRAFRADASGRDGRRHVFEVSELTRSVKDVIESEFPFVWVRGQVTNVSRPGSGHLYFSVRDAEASLAVVWFKGAQGGKVLVGGGRYNPLTGEVDENSLADRLADGMTAGLAYEGLNQAGGWGGRIIVVLNDNEMSISKNVGALSLYLSRKLAQRWVKRFKRDLEGWVRSLPYGGELMMPPAAGGLLLSYLGSLSAAIKRTKMTMRQAQATPRVR